MRSKTTVFASGARWLGEALIDSGELMVMAGVSGTGAVARRVRLL